MILEEIKPADLKDENNIMLESGYMYVRLLLLFL